MDQLAFPVLVEWATRAGGDYVANTSPGVKDQVHLLRGKKIAQEYQERRQKERHLRADAADGDADVRLMRFFMAAITAARRSWRCRSPPRQ